MGSVIFSTVATLETFNLATKFGENEFEITIFPNGIVTNPLELLNVLGRQFKISQKGLKMQEIQRKYFNPNKKIEYSKHQLEIWPGFISAVNIIGSKIFVNIDLSFKVIRRVTAL